MPRENTAYRGRFAPSPTGPLHLGLLIAALASYLDARRHGGAWLVRMDDLDPPREEPGAARSILNSLRHHGLHWDEEVLYQGTRSPAYDAALARLGAAGLLFACDCSRARLGDAGNCQGNCRARQAELDSARSIRIDVPPACDIRFPDLLQGPQRVPLGRELPDFILRRKDGLYAYQLAVVVDDAAQGITHIVRGSDLLDSTARQVYLQQCLGLPTPRYGHLPVITNREGRKFSKQNLAPALDNAKAVHNLRLALRFLNQPEPPGSITRVGELLTWATGQWDLLRVPAEMEIAARRLGLGGLNFTGPSGFSSIDGLQRHGFRRGRDAMYINRLLLLVVGAFLIFLPAIESWIIHSETAWYRPFLFWLLVVVAAYWNQRSRYPDEL